jgi:hypothetical protein
MTNKTEGNQDSFELISGIVGISFTEYFNDLLLGFYYSFKAKIHRF